MRTPSAPDSPRAQIRGAIRTSVSTSRDALIAGDHFSVFVKVQNPFEVPLRLISISAFVPVEFYDIEQRRQDLLARARNVGGTMSQGIRALWGLIGASRGHDLVDSTTRLGVVTARSIEGRRAGDAHESSESGGLLQPGNTTTEVFTLCTRRERRFRPGSYRMQVSVRYRFESAPEDEPTDSGAIAENTDVIDVVLDVRASLSSILLGGAMGCLAGWLARNLSSWSYMGTPTAIGQALIHVLLACGVLLLFARKKDVQPLLSVEDAYGGALIGFMIGFSGAESVAGMFSMPAS